jgi:hypothetical protein
MVARLVKPVRRQDVEASSSMMVGTAPRHWPCASKKKAPDLRRGQFEQGGFTSGRRKDPKTLFPGTRPENSVLDATHASETHATSHRD